MAKIFIHLDGDDIGSRIELLLLDGKLDEATALSERVTQAMNELRNFLERIPGARIRLFGGDDLIAEIPAGSLSANVADQFREAFKKECGSTISAGVGASVEEALANLRRAKLSGKNRLLGHL